MKKTVFWALTLIIMCLFAREALAAPQAALVPGHEGPFNFSRTAEEYSIEVEEIVQADSSYMSLENGKFIFMGLFGNMTYNKGDELASTPRLFLRFHSRATNTATDWVVAPSYSKKNTPCDIVDHPTHVRMKKFECMLYIPSDGFFRSMRVEMVVASIASKTKKIAVSDLFTYDHSPSYFITFDYDGDNVPDENDNCFKAANTDQADGDGDGLGDVCDDKVDAAQDPDPCADDAASDECIKTVDADADGFTGDVDLCPDVAGIEPDGCPAAPEGVTDEPAVLDDSSADSISSDDASWCSFVPNTTVNPFLGFIMAAPLFLLLARTRPKRGN